MKNLNANEVAVLEYLRKTGESCTKSQIGVVVGKRQPKNAAAWSGPILESLIGEKAVEQITEGNKTLYKAIKTNESVKPTKTPKGHTPPEVLEAIGVKLPNKDKKDHDVLDAVTEKKVRKSHPANIEGSKEFNEVNEKARKEDEKPKAQKPKVEKTKPEKVKKEKGEGEFNFKKAKKEIFEIANSLIEKMTVNETKGVLIAKAVGEWQKKNCEIPEDFFQRIIRPIKRKLDPAPEKEKGKPRTNLLDVFDKNAVKQLVATELKKLKADKEIVEGSYKRELIKFLKEYIAQQVSEKSMKANIIKSFISTVVSEALTGKEREYKDDGRPFEKGQHVEYNNKQGIVCKGTIVKVYMCKVGFQRTIIIQPDDGSKKEMKVDRKIIKVIR